MAALLPDGVDPLDLEGMLVVDRDGQVTEDAFDLDLEQQMLLHTLRKLDTTAGVVSDRELQSEIDQETAFTLLYKQGDQAVYEAGRSDLIRSPSGAVDDLCELRLPRWSRTSTGRFPTTHSSRVGGSRARYAGGRCGSSYGRTAALW
ncbi:hypothetical protein NKH18_27375 [Streptomyces sp. M10(2022)]